LKVRGARADFCGPPLIHTYIWIIITSKIACATLLMSGKNYFEFVLKEVKLKIALLAAVAWSWFCQQSGQ
jgi:hypothetical protein